jgi:predicted MarR family transcription regulator
MALLRALCHWRHLTAGLTNRSLRELVAAQLHCPYSARQATYDLRRLRRKGLIERVPGRHRYTLTALGRRVASFFTKLHLRVVRPALTDLDPGPPADSRRQRSLAQAWRRLDQVLDTLIARAELAPQM